MEGAIVRMTTTSEGTPEARPATRRSTGALGRAWLRRAGRSRVHKIGFGLFGVGAAVLLSATPAMAQEITPAEFNGALLTSLWLIVAGCLVFLMQAGFALVEAGLTRAKNIGNIMAKNLADMAIGALAFWAVGFGFAFGTDGGSLIGTDTFFLSGMSESFADGDVLATPSFFFFQVVFAATAVTIASGAMAERTKFSAYLLFSLVMSGFIYPVVVHMFWHGDGILSDLAVGDARFSDFAGSSIVHSAGGWAALMGAVFLGPRLGKYGPDGTPRALPGHNVGYAVVGVFILWFGWFGFNGGSQLALSSTADANAIASAFVNTNISAAGGTVAAYLFTKVFFKKADLTMILNGALAGLVAITAQPVTPPSWLAAIVGFTAGILLVLSIIFLDKLHIDDPVGAISVHGVVGIFGTLVVPISDSGATLLNQLIGASVILAWGFLTSFVLWGLLKFTIGIRVTKEQEYAGLDKVDCGVEAYPEFIRSPEGQ